MWQAWPARFACIAGIFVVCYAALPGTLPPEGLLDREAPIRFRDVAHEAGIDFVLENCPTDRKHLI
jgi:hypothetical protein